MGVRFFFDEGLGQNLSKGLGLLGKNVEHVLDKFDPGTRDVIWLEYIGERGYALITKDKGIRKKPNEKAMLRKYKIVAFYLGGSEKSGHDIVKQLVNVWENMEEKADKALKAGRAAAFLVNPSGRSIEPIPLT